MGVDATQLEQLLMRALFHDAVFRQHPDDGGVADGGKPVSDGKGGASLGQLFQGFLHQALAFIVQGAGGLVQNQDGRIFQKYTRDGDALLLPARELDTPLAHEGIIPFGQPGDEFVRPGQPRGLPHLFGGGAGHAVGNVVKDGAGEQVDILLHHADVFAQAVLGQVGDVLPVDENASAGNVIKAGNQVAKRGLAAAAGADQRHPLAGVDVEVDVGQHVFVVVAVMEADVVEGYVAAHMGQFHGVGRVLDIGCFIHDFAEALDAGYAALKLLHEIHDAADGGQQGIDIEQIGHVIRRGDGPLNDEQRPHDHHHNVHQSVEDARSGVEAGHIEVFAAVDAHKLVVAVMKLFHFNRLVGKALDHADAQQAVLHLGVDLAHLVAAFAVDGAHALVEKARARYHQRQHGKDDERERGAGPHQNDEGDDDFDTRDEKFLRAVMGELRHLKQVAGDAGHDLAHLGVAVIGKAQRLQMGEEVVSHVALNEGAHDVPAGGHVEIGQRVHDAQKHVDAAHPEHKAHRKSGEVIGGQVGHIAHDEGQHQVAHGGQRRAHQIQKQHAPVLFKIGQEPADER